MYDTLTRVHPGKDHSGCAAHGAVPKSARDLVGFDKTRRIVEMEEKRAREDGRGGVFMPLRERGGALR